MNILPYYKTVKYANFHEMLYGLNKEHSNEIAIKYRKNKLIDITYGELIEQISSLYNFYQQKNIKNQNIGIIAENRYEYITTYLSSVFLNVIAPIDKEIGEESLKKLLINFDIKVLFYTNKTKGRTLIATKNLSIKLINLDEEYLKIVKKKYSVGKFFKETKSVENDKFSILAFTSGTTGEIKGAMLTQNNVVSNLRAALENNILKTPTLSILPMNHTYGFNPGVLNTFYNAGTVCINLELKYIVRDLKYYNPYFIAVVPMVVEGMYNNIIREARRKNKYKLLQKMIKISNFLLKFKIDLRHLFFGNIINKRLRLMVSGGAMLNPIYIKKFDELGITLLNGYGLTECSPLVAVNREVNNISESVGTIIKDDKVKIAKDGEILVKGPNVMLGYYNNQKSTNEVLVDGYFKTGDLGYVKNRVIFVTGRKKNLIILKNGKNFSPEEIESKFLELSYVKECIVTTKEVNKNSIIIAKIFLEEKTNILQTDIDEINKKLPYYMKIDEVEIMEKEFEKNSSKKIIRSKYV